MLLRAVAVSKPDALLQDVHALGKLLGKLSDDSSSEVRDGALRVLGALKKALGASETVLEPYLQGLDKIKLAKVNSFMRLDTATELKEGEEASYSDAGSTGGEDIGTKEEAPHEKSPVSVPSAASSTIAENIPEPVCAKVCAGCCFRRCVAGCWI